MAHVSYGSSPAKTKLCHLPEQMKPEESKEVLEHLKTNFSVLLWTLGKTPKPGSKQEQFYAPETHRPQLRSKKEEAVQELTLAGPGHQICLRPQEAGV